MVNVNVCIKRNWKVYRFSAEDNILQTLRIALQLKRHTTWYQAWYVQFTKEKKDHTEAGKQHVSLGISYSTQNEDLEKCLRKSKKKIIISFLEYQKGGNNLKLNTFIEMKINVANASKNLVSFLPQSNKKRKKQS